MRRRDSDAGAWEGAGFGEDDHAVGAGDVAFDEVLGGRLVCLLLRWWWDRGDGWGVIWLLMRLVVSTGNMQYVWEGCVCIR